MTGILNYGVGNILAFEKIFKKLNKKLLIVNSKSDIKKCDRLILPGVGHFDVAMKRLNNSGLKEELDDFVNIKKKPLLGICVGMQMLGNFSEEGTMNGLGYIPGDSHEVDKTVLSQKPYTPHMGWNSIDILINNPIIDQIKNKTHFYFLHSYYFVPNNKDFIVCQTNYGDNFSSIISNNKVFGIQFHPEKSHSQGIQILKNFSEIK